MFIGSTAFHQLKDIVYKLPWPIRSLDALPAGHVLIMKATESPHSSYGLYFIYRESEEREFQRDLEEHNTEEYDLSFYSVLYSEAKERNIF